MRLAQHPACTPKLRERLETIERRLSAMTPAQLDARMRWTQQRRPFSPRLIAVWCAILVLISGVALVLGGSFDFAGGYVRAGLTELFIGIALLMAFAAGSITLYRGRPLVHWVPTRVSVR